MNASAIKVYEIFKENLKLGEEKASMVIKYLENSTAEKISNEIKSKIEHLATKEDINELKSELKDDIVVVREDMLKLENSLKEDLLKSESSLRENITQLRADTKNDISAVREDMLKLESSLREEILKSESSLKEDIQKLHASTIKWMFVFWVGTVGAIIGVIKFL